MIKAFYAALITATAVVSSFAADSVQNSATDATAAPAANADSEQKNDSKKSDVKVEDVARVIVDKDAQIDAKTLLTQIDAMLASNPERTKNINKSNFKISMLQARTFEEVLYAAAQKINLQNVPEIKEQIEMAKRQILVRAYISKVMADRIKEEDLKILYSKVIKEYPKPGIRIGHILVKEENTAKEVIAALDKGEKFEDVAKKYSIAASKDKGGAEDLVPLDALTPQMNELKQLDKGQYIRTPLQSKHGFHIVCVLSKENVEAPVFEAIRRNLEGELFKVELEKLTKTLLKTINVKGYNDQGKEIDIMPLLTMQVSPDSIGGASPAADASAPVNEQLQNVEATVKESEAKQEEKTEATAQAEEKSAEQPAAENSSEGTPPEEEPSEHMGFFDRIMAFIKSFF